MFTIKTMSTRAAAVALVALLALAPRAARSQGVPRPAGEIRRITALAGEFDGDASYTSGGRTVRFTLHHTNRVIAGGFGLACHEQAELPGLGHYEAENLFGWDAGRRMLHLFSVTTDPNTHDHAGAWRDSMHVTLRYEGLRDGQRIIEVIPFEIIGPDAYRFRSTVTVPGQSPEVFEATMRRVEGVAGK
jgi:hypothetical protein